MRLKLPCAWLVQPSGQLCNTYSTYERESSCRRILCAVRCAPALAFFCFGSFRREPPFLCIGTQQRHTQDTKNFQILCIETQQRHTQEGGCPPDQPKLEKDRKSITTETERDQDHPSGLYTKRCAEKDEQQGNEIIVHRIALASIQRFRHYARVY